MQVNLPEKRYYGIGELAKAFDVNASLIRFWDKEFDEINPKKNAKGDRMFRPDDVKVLQMIYHLVKERGFTLEGAKIHLKEGKKKTLDSFEIINKLEGIKNKLQEMKNGLWYSFQSQLQFSVIKRKKLTTININLKLNKNGF